MATKWLVTLAAVVGMAAGIGLYITVFGLPQFGSRPSTPVKAEISVVGKPRPSFHLSDLEGKPRDLSEWNGKVMLINFWATWCPPCVREMPALMELRRKYQGQGFEIIGVALDTRDAVIDFVNPLGIEYPILMAEHEGLDLNQQYGNRLGVLPYSVIVDRNGVIRHTIISEILFEDGEKLIMPLLAEPAR